MVGSVSTEMKGLMIGQQLQSGTGLGHLHQ
jgi:hypothetical protein